MTIVKELRAPNGMRVSFEQIGPEEAAAYLEKNDRNRRLNPNVVWVYAKDMDDGNWRIIPHAICIAKDGTLLNGQHTLSAVIASGVTLWLMIARDVHPEVAAVIDSGKKRTYNDQARILGVTDRKGKHLSLAGSVELGELYFRNSAVRSGSYDDRSGKFDTHKEAIDFVESLGMKGPQAIQTVMGRAYYSQDADKLKEFADAFSGTTSADKSHPARQLQLFLAGLKGRTSSGQTQIEVYQKAQSALRAFLNGETLYRLRATSGDVFQGVPLTK